MIQECSSGRICMKVSDFGLSKVLDLDRSTFTQSKGAAGTRGWMAQEVLSPPSDKNPSCAIDIFSLGCIFYYTLTRGHHPFGEGVHCQSNILNGQYSFEHLSNSDPENVQTKMLLERMIRPHPDLRPKTGDVLKHPLFF